MKKKLYLITGIPLRMTKESKVLRTDMKLFKENEDIVRARLPLTPLQALIMRIQMVHYNLTHPCRMELIKMKAKRYRV